MLVGIEASAAVGSRRTGVGNYAANVIAGLQRLGEAAGEVRFVYFSNRYGTSSDDNIAGLTAQTIYPRDRLPMRTLWMQIGLARSIARTRPDLCHFPNHLAPVLTHSETPFVVTMHDMSVYRCPQFQPFKTVAVHRAIMPAVARRTRLIVTVSESARQDILHYLKVPPERVRVVYEGIGAHFWSHDHTDQPPTPEVRQRYDLHFPYILTVGTLEPRKNHAGLIDAFIRLVQQERFAHHLVIVGARGWKEDAVLARVKKSGLSHRIHLLGYVPTADLPELYRGATAFAFPSFYEGFGLPVLEAFASGTPTLISSASALTEVAGKGTALVVDAESIEDIACGLHRLLVDRELAASLRAKGFVRAREFSWDRCAAETFQLYQEVLGNGSGVVHLNGKTPSTFSLSSRG